MLEGRGHLLVRPLMGLSPEPVFGFTLLLQNVPFPSKIIFVRDTAQENVMNAHGRTRLFLVVVNQPNNVIAISTRQTII